MHVAPVEATQVKAGSLKISDATSSQPQSDSQLAQRCSPAELDQNVSSSESSPAKVLASSEVGPGGKVSGRGGVVVVTMADVHTMGSAMPRVE